MKPYGRRIRLLALAFAAFLGLIQTGCHKSAFGIRGMSGLGESMTQRNPVSTNVSRVHLVDIIDAQVFLEYPKDSIAMQPTSGMEIEFRGARTIGAVIQRQVADFEPNLTDKDYRFSVCAYIEKPWHLKRAIKMIEEAKATENERRPSGYPYRCFRVERYEHMNLKDGLHKSVYGAAAKFGIPVVISYTKPNFERVKRDKTFISQLEQVVEQYPETTFVVSHLGFPYVSETVKLMRERKNIYTDTSGLVSGDADLLTRTEALEKVLSHVEHFTEFPDRLMFGSSWPNTNIGPYSHLIQSAIPESIWRKVFYENAVKLYKLDLELKREISSIPTSAKPLIKIPTRVVKPKAESQEAGSSGADVEGSRLLDKSLLTAPGTSK